MTTFNTVIEKIEKIEVICFVHISLVLSHSRSHYQVFSHTSLSYIQDNSHNSLSSYPSYCLLYTLMCYIMLYIRSDKF